MNEEHFLRIIQYLERLLLFPIAIGIVIFCCLILFVAQPELIQSFLNRSGSKEETSEKKNAPAPNSFITDWIVPDSTKIPESPEGNLIRYGNELVAHTAYYLGPQGKIQVSSNGMNCQNCHLKAGKKIFGNNYSAVASTYPKFRARSGSIESIEKRVNDCIERSLNGKPLNEDSRELQAFVAYISWVGKDVVKGKVPKGAGLWDLPLLDRPADATNGKTVFNKSCVVCHGKNGEGQKTENGLEWKYPPLWGEASYNTGAGLYRLSRFAGYVKANMPNGATFENPILTDEEAWDVAAFVNSMPRPTRSFVNDWPDISKKPFDHPFGPYTDSFPEDQHKYGPFAEIKKLLKH